MAGLRAHLRRNSGTGIAERTFHQPNIAPGSPAIRRSNRSTPASAIPGRAKRIFRRHATRRRLPQAIPQRSGLSREGDGDGRISQRIGSRRTLCLRANFPSRSGILNSSKVISISSATPRTCASSATTPTPRCSPIPKTSTPPPAFFITTNSRATLTPPSRPSPTSACTKTPPSRRGHPRNSTSAPASSRTFTPTPNPLATTSLSTTVKISRTRRKPRSQASRISCSPRLKLPSASVPANCPCIATSRLWIRVPAI